MKIKILNVQLEFEETQIRTSDYKGFQKCLDKGFYVHERAEGFYVLKRASKIWVTIEHNGKRSKIDLQKSLSLYYKERENKKLYYFFQKDLEDNKVELTLDSNGYYTLIEK